MQDIEFKTLTQTHLENKYTILRDIYLIFATIAIIYLIIFIFLINDTEYIFHFV